MVRLVKWKATFALLPLRQAPRRHVHLSRSQGNPTFFRHCSLPAHRPRCRGGHEAFPVSMNAYIHDEIVMSIGVSAGTPARATRCGTRISSINIDGRVASGNAGHK
jgi:hypothetical protein